MIHSQRPSWWLIVVFFFLFLSLKRKRFSVKFTTWDYRFWRTILANAMATSRIKMSSIISRMKWWEFHFPFPLPLYSVTISSQHPVIDYNSENSNCSWEAIDDRNSAFPVLWVPDHAITRCQNCQIEFWLGRRKHHCRSCGNIFCGDCSQYFAPFPRESFLEPVRLCGSCFQSVGWTFACMQHD